MEKDARIIIATAGIENSKWLMVQSAGKDVAIISEVTSEKKSISFNISVNFTSCKSKTQKIKKQKAKNNRNNTKVQIHD